MLGFSVFHHNFPAVHNNLINGAWQILLVCNKVQRARLSYSQYTYPKLQFSSSHHMKYMLKSDTTSTIYFIGFFHKTNHWKKRASLLRQLIPKTDENIIRQDLKRYLRHYALTFKQK